ncbi:unnamed protein product [Candida verbasci]|uniref:Nucleoporin Nup133/Nup155-like N-terminal domain-containing protein n=1 Tax=Candida verbasci TaxID=1227364 RepID=A0A9W4TWI6_9ASCO|nr:unnamed protein product [Candida verbasci]
MSVVKRQKIEDSNQIRKYAKDEEIGDILYNKSVVLEGHQGPVSSSIFNHDGSRIASSGMDRKIQLWNLPTVENECNIFTFESIHNNAITSLAWLDNLLISSSADSTLSILDLYSQRKIKKLHSGHKGVINQIYNNEDTKQILSCGDDGKIYFWDYRESKTPTNSITTDYPILTLTGNDSSLYFSGIDCLVHAYDVRKVDTELWNCFSNCHDGITSLSISPDKSNLISRSLNGIIRIYNINESLPKGFSRLSNTIFDGAPSGKENWLIRTCFSNNNLSIFSGSEDYSVTQWDITGEVVNKFEGHEGTVIDVNYHPTENIMMSSSTDGTIILREL